MEDQKELLDIFIEFYLCKKPSFLWFRISNVDFEGMLNTKANQLYGLFSKWLTKITTSLFNV